MKIQRPRSVGWHATMSFLCTSNETPSQCLVAFSLRLFWGVIIIWWWWYATWWTLIGSVAARLQRMMGGIFMSFHADKFCLMILKFLNGLSIRGARGRGLPAHACATIQKRVWAKATSVSNGRAGSKLQMQRFLSKASPQLVNYWSGVVLLVLWYQYKLRSLLVKVIIIREIMII